MDVLEIPETGQGLRSWIRIDASGNSQVIEIDKLTIIHCCGLSAYDLRILDPLFVYPTTILGREKAIVANLEKIRCIITADQVLLLNSLDRNVLHYVMELQKRLTSTGVAEMKPRSSSTRSFRSTSSYSPFEFRALAVALEVVSGSFDIEASELQSEAYPLLDELTSKIRDEIKKIMDDSEDMGEMYPTEKKRKIRESSLNICDDECLMGFRSNDGGPFEASHLPVSSPSESSRRLTKNLSSRKSMMKAEKSAKNLEELESLLEAYFVVIDSILVKLKTLKEYIDDTENFINIQLVSYEFHS
ncbi:hypothetical protein CRYUN_Cryun31cG0111000 [Craigia yunnanensis]